MLREKSRIRWLSDGDVNTKYLWLITKKHMTLFAGLQYILQRLGFYSKWRRTISMVGRIYLINSVLFALPLGEEGQKKVPWMRWKKVCFPKLHGGLGVKNIEMINLSLLGKWKWYLFHQRDSIWGKIIDSKYGG
uniref:Ribonuclease H protein At1g65750 family n=1 Tax=Cajanus cajan TaxID=3821 RepID=A0A151R1M3_CAJCA|nr:Putative ribonuclease H protein At1g65750 family [Cajanus cajan]